MVNDAETSVGSGDESSFNDRGNVNANRQEIDTDTYYCQHVFLQLTQLEGWKGLSLQCVSAHWICRTRLVSNYAGSREVRRV